MRLLSFTVVGAAVIAAGLAAPASGAEDVPGDGMTVTPGVARPGERVRVSTPGCKGRAESIAFTEGARLGGRGTARLKRSIGAGTYTVVAECGGRQVSARLTVSTERSWPSLLPGALNPQMARATG
ncbi:hypothetical protein [Spirillospora sp. NPDC029432]|uniref:hypothetical protein n=1 Tax=Spirillospora sp. NPDC029432 TaxID=3154599 RepID=UPI003454575D